MDTLSLRIFGRDLTLACPPEEKDQLIKAAQEMPNKKFIVATDRGIFYKMQQLDDYQNLAAH